MNDNASRWFWYEGLFFGTGLWAMSDGLIASGRVDPVGWFPWWASLTLAAVCMTGPALYRRYRR